MDDIQWLPITPTTGDLYEIKMFVALLSNKENFVNGTPYWAQENRYASNKVAPFEDATVAKFTYKVYLSQFKREFTHILWINKTY